MPTLVPLTSYQYEAGSCTLKLVGQLSALSQLSDRPVLRRSRFQIQLRHGAGVPPEPTAIAAGRLVLELSGREPQLSELADVVRRYVQTYLHSEAITPVQAVSRGKTSLAPVGLTRHRLELAELDTATRPYAVELSTLQLADLAEVLEQADRAVDCLPEAVLPKHRAVPDRGCPVGRLGSGCSSGRCAR
ncbi:MAG: DUF4335 domain-containing protein [Leptolyngbyaceae cyanobacterium SM2_5_2]|nr:DUF4335 domain-containing protein [Leptolyngbyaceae cyanobacterium SM2_5_2]